MATKTAKNLHGPFLVGMAAFLWATDALVRYPAIETIDPGVIVFVEHVLAVLILLPWILYRYRNQLFALNKREWLSAMFSGAAGSAIATLFFTASFRYINPSVAVLLQKLQPIMVVVIAYLLLGERPAKKFFIWGLVALAAGIVLSFRDFNFNFLSQGFNLHSVGIQYAFGAALIWAASTVSGKFLLKKTPPTLAAFWRFFFGFIAVTLLLGLSNKMPSIHIFESSNTVFFLIYLSLIPGLWAMLTYYNGLAKTPASVTTFVELLYPIGAVILNTIFLHTPLEPIQTIAGIVLLFAVTMLSL